MGENQLRDEKKLFKKTPVDETLKRMKLFAGHDESFNTGIITLTCKSNTFPASQCERLVLNIL